MFQIQTKDGSYRRGTLRPTKASSAFGILPIYNHNKYEGLMTPQKNQTLKRCHHPVNFENNKKC